VVSQPGNFLRLRSRFASRQPVARNCFDGGIEAARVEDSQDRITQTVEGEQFIAAEAIVAQKFLPLIETQRAPHDSSEPYAPLRISPSAKMRQSGRTIDLIGLSDMDYESAALGRPLYC
jgi:hypothetical protein